MADTSIDKYEAIPTLKQPAWDIQTHAHETAKVYGYFMLYRDLGPNRSIIQVAAETDISQDLMYKYSRKFRWQERAQAWDVHLEREKTKAIEDAHRTMASRQAKIGMMLQDKAVMALGKLDFNEDNPPSVKDVVALADTGVKIERLARGEKTTDDSTIIIQLPSMPGWAKNSQFASNIEQQPTAADIPVEALTDGTNSNI